MITIYGTHCPKCKVLEKKFEQSGIEYTMIDDPHEVIKFGELHGIRTMPIVDNDGEVMDFSCANVWINSKIK